MDDTDGRRTPVEGYEFLGGLTSGERSFRDDLLAWLERHLAGEFAELRGVGGPADEAGWDARVRWEKELAAGHWRGVGWPRQFGGRGAPFSHQLIFEYEYARSGAAYRPSSQSEQLFGPTMIRWGTDEQRARFLPPILTSSEFWCQGFSEPDVGSDLASVRTTAQRDADRWVINGQKIWTTFGHLSQWIYVLCRTDPDAAKHAGLSMLLVPLHQDGIEIRRIRTLAGNADFNEVFFTDASTDATMVLGEVNGGWAVAMSLLGVERGTAVLPHQLTFESDFRETVQLARASAKTDVPMVRQRLADAWTGLRLIAWRNLRQLRFVAEGGDLGSEVSVGKLASSHWHQRLAVLQADLLGLDSMLVEPEYELPSTQRLLLQSRAETIYGGTSEIQRNIIAERVLGLPR